MRVLLVAAVIVVLFFVAIALTSCTVISTADRDALLARGSALTDRAIEDSELLLCRVSTVGAVMRRYWTDEKLFRSWLTICGYDKPIALEEILRSIPRPPVELQNLPVAK